MISEVSRKGKDENTLSSLEVNAKTLGETCEKKLRSIQKSDTKSRSPHLRAISRDSGNKLNVDTVSD